VTTQKGTFFYIKNLSPAMNTNHAEENSPVAVIWHAEQTIAESQYLYTGNLVKLEEGDHLALNGYDDFQLQFVEGKLIQIKE
jgi:hypothetical protein